VHVALTVGGRCLLGAVALPAQAELVWGVCGTDSPEAGCTGGSRLIRGDSLQPDAPRIAVSRSHTPSWIPAFASQFGGVLVPSGSVGNKVAMMLLDRADVYVHKKGLKEWDTCAPECVARALGWTVCKLRGEDHRYNQPDPKNHELVVCRPEWKGRVLEALETAGALRS
jgi:3'(2'), 5'-bisphosphate nucleotidase